MSLYEILPTNTIPVGTRVRFHKGNQMGTVIRVQRSADTNVVGYEVDWDGADCVANWKRTEELVVVA